MLDLLAHFSFVYTFIQLKTAIHGAVSQELGYETVIAANPSLSEQRLSQKADNSPIRSQNHHDSRMAGSPRKIAFVLTENDLSTACYGCPDTPARSMSVSRRWSNGVIPGSTRHMFRIQQAFSGPMAVTKSWASSRAVTIEISGIPNQFCE